MNIFVDVGSHTGESTSAMWPRFDKVYCWEPNCAFEQNYDETSVTLIQAVADVRDGEALLYLGTDGKMQGSSIYADKLTGDLATSPVKVRSLRFATWLLRLPPAHITVKMDIEGAEYIVLPDMLYTRATDRVDRLLIEWHGDKLPSISQHEHDALVSAVGNAIDDVDQWTG